MPRGDNHFQQAVQSHGPNTSTPRRRASRIKRLLQLTTQPRQAAKSWNKDCYLQLRTYSLENTPLGPLADEQNDQAGMTSASSKTTSGLRVFLTESACRDSGHSLNPQAVGFRHFSHA